MSDIELRLKSHAHRGGKVQFGHTIVKFNHDGISEPVSEDVAAHAIQVPGFAIHDEPVAPTLAVHVDTSELESQLAEALQRCKSLEVWGNGKSDALTALEAQLTAKDAEIVELRAQITNLNAQIAEWDSEDEETEEESENIPEVSDVLIPDQSETPTPSVTPTTPVSKLHAVTTNTPKPGNRRRR